MQMTRHADLATTNQDATFVGAADHLSEQEASSLKAREQFLDKESTVHVGAIQNVRHARCNENASADSVVPRAACSAYACSKHKQQGKAQLGTAQRPTRCKGRGTLLLNRKPSSEGALQPSTAAEETKSKDQGIALEKLEPQQWSVRANGAQPILLEEDWPMQLQHTRTVVEFQRLLVRGRTAARAAPTRHGEPGLTEFAWAIHLSLYANT